MIVSDGNIQAMRVYLTRGRGGTPLGLWDEDFEIRARLNQHWTQCTSMPPTSQIPGSSPPGICNDNSVKRKRKNCNERRERIEENSKEVKAVVCEEMGREINKVEC